MKKFLTAILLALALVAIAGEPAEAGCRRCGESGLFRGRLRDRQGLFHRWQHERRHGGGCCGS